MNTLKRWFGGVKRIVGAAVALVGVTVAHAQAAATVPTPDDITTNITKAGAVAGGAAAIGLSVWLYRKVKAKAGQAIG